MAFTLTSGVTAISSFTTGANPQPIFATDGRRFDTFYTFDSSPKVAKVDCNQDLNKDGLIAGVKRKVVESAETQWISRMNKTEALERK